MTESKVLIVVAAIIENERREILLIKRSPDKTNPNCWEDVGGKLEPNEIPEIGLVREIAEETGITDVAIIKPLTIFQDFLENDRRADNELIGIAYWCSTTTTTVKLSSEHSDYQWVSPEKAMKLTDHPALRNYLPIYLQEKAKQERVDLFISR
jgi:8-oxo-dGTP diphosphatase